MDKADTEATLKQMRVAGARGATRSGGQAAGAGAEDSWVSGGKTGWNFVFTNFLKIITAIYTFTVEMSENSEKHKQETLRRQTSLEVGGV